MICPQCRSEYVDGITRCDECDVDLVETLPPEPGKPPKTVRDLLFGEQPQPPTSPLPGQPEPAGSALPGDAEAPDAGLPGESEPSTAPWPGGSASEDRLEVQLPGDSRMHAMRRVHVARTLADAYIVKDVLESQGFAAIVQGEHLVGIRGEVPLDVDSLPSVWVPESQAERATRAVTDSQGGPSEAGDWVCPNCDEEIDGQFTDCWQCGTTRP